ncbi:hypothetical protein D3C78_1973110 [compost metagenome]
MVSFPGCCGLIGMVASGELVIVASFLHDEKAAIAINSATANNLIVFVIYFPY